MAVTHVFFSVIRQNDGIFLAVDALKIDAVFGGGQESRLAFVDAVFVVGHIDGVVDDIGMGCFGVAIALNRVGEDGVCCGFGGQMIKITIGNGLVIGLPIGRCCGQAIANVEPNAAFFWVVVGRKVKCVVVGKAFDCLHINKGGVIGAWCGHVFWARDQAFFFGDSEIGHMTCRLSFLFRVYSSTPNSAK